MLAWMAAKVTFRVLIFVSALFFVFGPADFLVAVPGASDSTISGWADVLEAIYNDIGGCSSYIFLFILLFVLCFLHLFCC